MVNMIHTSKLYLNGSIVDEICKMAKKSCPILIVYSKYKNGQDFLYEFQSWHLFESDYASNTLHFQKVITPPRNLRLSFFNLGDFMGTKNMLLDTKILVIDAAIQLP